MIHAQILRETFGSPVCNDNYKNLNEKAIY